MWYVAVVYASLGIIVKHDMLADNILYKGMVDILNRERFPLRVSSI